jgi:transaldolase/glucose-6-phosphate isomerase
MLMNPLKELQVHGQSIWLDYIRRNLITSGELNRMVEEDGLRGMTSNPTIFEKAIAGSVDYDESLRRALENDPHLDIKSLYELLVIEDIQMATDVLKPIYDETRGADGYVSLEVSPALANDTDGTIAEARRLWKSVDRPNLMIKVPATKEGVPAFEQLIGEGINVNVTLMFSLQHYEAVAQAYIRGLRHCSNPAQLASVASFFVSRVDSAVDKELEAIGSKEALALRGKLAVANAKLAYERFGEIFHGKDFAELEDKGARVQRCLWASTSTKNREYSDVLYVDQLIGAETVNTLPPATFSAFRDHGKVEDTLSRNVADAKEQVAALDRLGINFEAITDKLQVDGVASFFGSFEALLEALKKKRESILSSSAEHQYLFLGTDEERVKRRVEEWQHIAYAKRLWKKDRSLWPTTPESDAEDRLGWLDLPRTMHDQIEGIDRFAKEIQREDFEHVVLLGMGGSSLAPEVFQSTFGSAKKYPTLVVLDSTHPDAVRNVESTLSPARTLFLVSSKSGTTTETLSFFYYFWTKVSEITDAPGNHFVAVTDPGTPLESLAKERGFRRVFHAPPDVGGRYSALSVFGLVPAALIGINIHRLLDRAWALMEVGSGESSIEERPGLFLGATLGELAASGRDKVTISTSSSLRALPSWIEQLIAESTGKNDKGIVPVVGELLAPPETYRSDRFFVHIQMNTDASDQEVQLSSLEFGGHPVARIFLKDKHDLGQEFLRWEIAVASAGSVLAIDPFNQPDVQLAKDLAKKAMERSGEGEGNGSEGALETVSAEDSSRLAASLEGFLRKAKPGDYVAVHAYLAPTSETDAFMQRFRLALRDRLRLATTFGYGPRFLHSTGQLHKGGANTGLFLQIVDHPSERLSVPETNYTFNDLIGAQALGDAEALLKRGRRILRIELGHGGVDALNDLLHAVGE